jgi:hypothetical protein
MKNTPENLEEAFDEIQKECQELYRKYGSRALVKASQDPFDYAIKLRTGEVIRFESLKFLDDGWVEINGIRFPGSECGFGVPRDCEGIPFPAPRGMDVRIADIVWVMDAPTGS